MGLIPINFLTISFISLDISITHLLADLGGMDEPSPSFIKRNPIRLISYTTFCNNTPTYFI